VCDERLIYDVAIPVLRALLIGDPRIVKTLKEAIKEADHIFRRDREPVLVRQALAVMSAIGETGKNPERLKKAIEERFYPREPLPQYRWNRLRKALDLPKRETGAAAASYQRKP
jgi:hypothetical protein